MEISCQFVLPSRNFDELVAVVEYLETRSVVNPKEVALAKREEQKKKQGKANKKKKSKECVCVCVCVCVCRGGGGGDL